jgi:hypothetical protein
MKYYSVIKKNKHVICRKKDRTCDHHIKQNKPDSARQIPHFISYVESRSIILSKKTIFLNGTI